MKLSLPLVSAVLLLASCSTAYKTGQTPDDVYYSPERQRDEYVRVKKEDDRQYRNQLQTEEELREERYLRMKSRYRRYSTLDDADCYCYTGSNYNRYYDYYRFNNVGFYHNDWRWNTWNTWGWNAYNPYYYNPYLNNPYYTGVVVGNVRPVYNKPRRGNLLTYDNNNTSNVPTATGKPYSSNSSNSANDNYRSSGNNAGGFLRNVFGSGSSNSNSSSSSSSSSKPSSSSSSSSSSGSGSSSSGSSSAPVRKF